MKIPLFYINNCGVFFLFFRKIPFFFRKIPLCFLSNNSGKEFIWTFYRRKHSNDNLIYIYIKNFGK